MRILFIIPSLRLHSKTKFLPVGITSVMTLVDQHDFDFDVFDIDVNDHEDDVVEAYLRDNAYDVVLTGSIVTHYQWMKWLTLTIKHYHPHTKIVVGNSVAGSIPELFLRHSQADFVVIGEGEFGGLAILQALRDNTAFSSIAGIAYKKPDGSIVVNQKRKACEIDTLPMIDWRFLDVDQYFKKAGKPVAGVINEDAPPKMMPIVTARGCVFKCTFCHYVFWDDAYRHRSAQAIVAEIRRNIDVYGANYFNFWDDLSFSHLDQAEQVVDAILASGLSFQWTAAVRSDLFGNPKRDLARRIRVAEKFKRSGCLRLGYSLESGNQDILDMMNKRVKKEYFTEQAKLLADVDIISDASVVFGYPQETARTIAETFSMCRQARVYPSIGFLLPLPYTKMYEYAKLHGFITDEDAYLDSITERQDININMTKLSDEAILAHIKDGAAALSDDLSLALPTDRLIKTGGYREHHKETSSNAEKKLVRTRNDVSLSYAESVFEKQPPV